MGAPIKLDQYPTPAWAARCLWDEHFSDLDAQDVVWEPTCGEGRFLQAIPEHIRAYGCEIDPALAEKARRLTGRTIVTGDFLKVVMPEPPTAVIGNPPFQLGMIDKMLDRFHAELPEGGRVGLLLPAYAFQTAGRVVRYSERWSLQQQAIPRNIYPGLAKPLLFALFRKDQRRLMVGFSLYHEAAFIQSLPKDIGEAMVHGPATWSQIVFEAIEACGGEANLAQIYEYVCSRRPTENPAWREQVRKICGERAVRVKRARYSIPELAAKAA